eukprot:TRINITY_DN2597_c5_g1_i3.p1 TRINITY_DN2597_c5_g1~~TRINITY_DN2597_c5_g1_i3.p1  ORF type:complete len:834 (+),score=165.26 TRINITY_DN2597_c5_g1_i3:92-2503(+)
MSGPWGSPAGSPHGSPARTRRTARTACSAASLRAPLASPRGSPQRLLDTRLQFGDVPRERADLDWRLSLRSPARDGDERSSPCSSPRRSLARSLQGSPRPRRRLPYPLAAGVAQWAGAGLLQRCGRGVAARGALWRRLARLAADTEDESLRLPAALRLVDGRAFTAWEHAAARCGGGAGVVLAAMVSEEVERVRLRAAAALSKAAARRLEGHSARDAVLCAEARGRKAVAERAAELYRCMDRLLAAEAAEGTARAELSQLESQLRRRALFGACSGALALFYAAEKRRFALRWLCFAEAEARGDVAAAERALRRAAAQRRDRGQRRAVLASAGAGRCALCAAECAARATLRPGAALLLCCMQECSGRRAVRAAERAARAFTRVHAGWGAAAAQCYETRRAQRESRAPPAPTRSRSGAPQSRSLPLPSPTRSAASSQPRRRAAPTPPRCATVGVYSARLVAAIAGARPAAVAAAAAVVAASTRPGSAARERRTPQPRTRRRAHGCGAAATAEALGALARKGLQLRYWGRLQRWHGERLLRAAAARLAHPVRPPTPPPQPQPQQHGGDWRSSAFATPMASNSPRHSESSESTVVSRASAASSTSSHLRATDPAPAAAVLAATADVLQPRARPSPTSSGPRSLLRGGGSEPPASGRRRRVAWSTPSVSSAPSPPPRLSAQPRLVAAAAASVSPSRPGFVSARLPTPASSPPPLPTPPRRRSSRASGVPSPSPSRPLAVSADAAHFAALYRSRGPTAAAEYLRRLRRAPAAAADGARSSSRCSAAGAGRGAAPHRQRAAAPPRARRTV